MNFNKNTVEKIYQAIKIELAKVNYKVVYSDYDPAIANVYIDSDSDVDIIIRSNCSLNADLCVDLSYDAEYLSEYLDMLIDDAIRIDDVIRNELEAA